MSNRFLPIPAGTSPDQQLAIINKNFAELDNQAATSLFKIVKSGTGSITGPAVSASAGTWTSGSNATVIPHGLGFVPAAFVFLDFSIAHDGSDLVGLPWTNIPTTGPNSASLIMQMFFYALDKSNLTVIASNTVFGTTQGSGTTPFKYYLLQESAN